MTLTNLAYSEFDSTQQTLISDLLDKILLSASWSKISSTTSLASTTANASASATSLTFGTGVVASAGFYIGQVIRIGEKGAADCEYRTITGTSSTTISIAATTYAHNSGTNVYIGNEVLKATTTRGADMIIDLMDAHVVLPTTYGLNMAAYTAHTGNPNGGGSNRAPRNICWRYGSPTASNVIHCIVSVSKEHLFISLEGPRYGETNPSDSGGGSVRQYLFINDLVPYFDDDEEPCVVLGAPLNLLVSSTDLFCHQSINQAGTNHWEQTKLGTLTFPNNRISYSAHLERMAAGDGNWYLFPYVAFGDYTGIRGRLANIWFAGFINPEYNDPVVPSPPAFSKITYGGDTYKLLPLNKGVGGSRVWGPLGAVDNYGNAVQNIVAAIPCT